MATDLLPPVRVVGFVGPPETGKSTRAIQALDDLSRAGIRTWLHDPYGDAPRKLLSGDEIPVHWCSSSARLAIRSDLDCHRRAGEREILGRHSPSPGALLSAAVRAARPQRPIAIMIDELGVWPQASPHRLGPGLRRILSGRRHMGLWILWCAQWARQIHYSVIAQSNWLVVFRVTDARDLARLHEGGVDRTTTDKLRGMGEHDARLVRILGGDTKPLDFSYCETDSPTKKRPAEK